MNAADLDEAVSLILLSEYTVAFTGAGISVESGIPAFRGKGGIWNLYDPSILSLQRYRSEGHSLWPQIRSLFHEKIRACEPNLFHRFLAFLEREDLLKGVVTQNIDNLHYQAGSRQVAEFHGNTRRMVCEYCGNAADVEPYMKEGIQPDCPLCGHFMKPDFIFFGESIPGDAYEQSIHWMEKCELLIIAGCSGEVTPANMLPGIARDRGAEVIEINIDRTYYTDAVTDVFLQGSAVEISKVLQEKILRTRGSAESC